MGENWFSSKGIRDPFMGGQRNGYGNLLCERMSPKLVENEARCQTGRYMRLCLRKGEWIHGSWSWIGEFIVTWDFRGWNMLSSSTIKVNMSSFVWLVIKRGEFRVFFNVF